MNREEYRKAFDELSFSADFQERTADLLRNRARELEKERTNMTFNRTKRIVVLIFSFITSWHENYMPPWFLAATLLLTFGPMIFFLVQLWRVR